MAAAHEKGKQPLRPAYNDALESLVTCLSLGPLPRGELEVQSGWYRFETMLPLDQFLRRHAAVFVVSPHSGHVALRDARDDVATDAEVLMMLQSCLVDGPKRAVDISERCSWGARYSHRWHLEELLLTRPDLFVFQRGHVHLRQGMAAPADGAGSSSSSSSPPPRNAPPSLSRSPPSVPSTIVPATTSSTSSALPPAGTPHPAPIREPRHSVNSPRGAARPLSASSASSGGSHRPNRSPSPPLWTWPTRCPPTCGPCSATTDFQADFGRLLGETEAALWREPAPARSEEAAAVCR
eukprot:EG_transcript_19448